MKKKAIRGLCLLAFAQMQLPLPVDSNGGEERRGEELGGRSGRRMARRVVFVRQAVAAGFRRELMFFDLIQG